MESTVFAGKTLLITGGTGSFGNTVLKHFLSTDIGEIRIFSRDEKKQDDMRHDYQLKYPELSGKIKFYIGDVRNPDSLRGVMRGVDYIFHAAALKQVPSCEFFPMEAVRTNVLGTDNVLTAAIDAGVKKVVCLSTDKAAYPINAMGISKAMMEKVIGAKARTVKAEATTICCTRYGNVMASDEEPVAEEDILMMVEAGEETGTVDEREHEMIKNIFEFDDRKVSEIMTHRTDVVGVPVTATLPDIVALQAENRFSRIPVYKEDLQK